MEVTPEMYAWLASQNIIDSGKSLRELKGGTFSIPKKTLDQLQGGKYWDKLLSNLQESYNRFYKLKLYYLDGLSQLKPIDDKDEYISNSIKYFNWQLINRCLHHFGLIYSEDQIISLSNGNNGLLVEILNKVFSLGNEFSKRSEEPVKPTGQEQKKLTRRATTPNSSKRERNITTPNDNQVPANSVSGKNKNETININTLNPNKEYDKCESPLEFFIVSLSKNFNLSARQSVALLSNNRKYLSILCNKGLKGKYTSILHWIQDLSINNRHMISLLSLYDDGIGMGFATISSSLCSKNKDVVYNGSLLISKIQTDLGCDWDWFVKEGIDALFFAIIKHEDLRLHLFSLLYDLTKNKLNEFVGELKTKSLTKDKKKLFEFFSSTVSMLKEIDKMLFDNLKYFLFEMCFDENEDKSFSVSLLCDAWFYFDPIEQHLIDNILLYIKKCSRDKRGNVSATALTQSFSLLNRFGKIKTESAPHIYKTIVFLFLENYDNVAQREIVLISFERFFNENKTVPIDIFIDPYVKQIKASTNYNISDLTFLFKLIEHPRLTSSNIKNIIEFILEVSMQSLAYARTANLILTLLFHNKIIWSLCDEEDVQHLMLVFIDYIKNMIHIFMSNIEGVEDRAILETPYDIMNEGLEEINPHVHDSLVEAVKEYRRIKGVHSNCLLAMLWVYDDNDDVLLQVEEMFRIKYAPVLVVLKKQQKEKEEKDRRNFKKKNRNLLANIKKKKEADETNKQKQENDQIEKENKIKKKLEAQRKRASIMLGIEPVEESQGGNSLIFLQTHSQSKQSRMHTHTDEFGINRNQTEQGDNNKSQLDTILEQEREEIKKEAIGMLILDEGSIIKPTTIQSIKKQKYITSEVYKNFILPINLVDEEDRELMAINGYNYQYKKSIKYYFRTYFNEVTQTMSKSNLLKMFRDKGYTKHDITLEELSIAIRNIFGDNINEVNYDQFCTLLVQLSYLIYIKRRGNLTISECYGFLLRYFVPSKLTPATVALNKKMQPVMDLIKKRLTSDDDEDAYFNLPPGFKIKEKTSVAYNCRLASHFLSFLSEPQYICYEIIEDLLFKLFNSSILEPYVKVTKSEEVELEPGKIKPWTKDLTVSYMLLPTEFEVSGIEVADCMDEMLRKICKGRDKKGNLIIPPIVKTEMEERKKYLEYEASKEEMRLKRHKEILQQVEEFKKEKQRKKKEAQAKMKADKVKRFKLIQEQIKETREENQRKITEVKEKRKAIEEEKQNKMIEEKEKMKEEQMKKLSDRQTFMNKQQRRLKEQFKMIRNQKELFHQRQYESLSLNYKLPRSNSVCMEKDKSYFDFEKKLNSTIKQLVNREDIKPVIDKYQQHIKVVFDVYSKIGYNKISFFSREAIQQNEFKEFLINFTVLGLLINTDQMNYIFKKITLESEKDKDAQDYFTYEEFIMSLCYLAIVSRFANRTRKILPVDIDNTNSNTIESFISFLGFKLPFNKLELEKFITDRRTMTMKNLLVLQKELRKEKVKEFKQTEFEKEMIIRKENRKKRLEEEYQKKLTAERERFISGKEKGGRESPDSRYDQTKETEENKAASRIMNTNASVKMDKVNPGINKVNPSIDKVNPATNKVNPPIDKVNPATNKVNPPIDKVNPPIDKEEDKSKKTKKTKKGNK